MGGFSNLGSALSKAGSYIAEICDAKPESVSDKEIKAATRAVKKANNLITESKKNAITDVEKSTINTMLRNIAGMQNGAKTDFNAISPSATKLLSALDSLKVNLQMIKQFQNHETESKNDKKDPHKKAELDLKSDVKIQGIKKGAGITVSKDLIKHLSLTDRGLEQLKKDCSAEGKGTTDGQFRKLTSILKKTDLALLKGMAFHKTIAPQIFPAETQKIISKILKEIAFIQTRVDLQVMSGTYQSQAYTFRSALDELKLRLLALSRLKRGKRIEKVDELEFEPKKTKK